MAQPRSLGKDSAGGSVTFELGALQQSIVAIATFTVNGDDSYRHSGGTRRQARGLDEKGQRRTIPDVTVK
ncbi:hypothetical protein [Nostoc sp.]|uniref:hypothetical protein n=1 Tax=Nostoc sp. TaxID=1180 RepID=UPI002FFA1E65